MALCIYNTGLPASYTQGFPLIIPQAQVPQLPAQSVAQSVSHSVSS